MNLWLIKWLISISLLCFDICILHAASEIICTALDTVLHDLCTWISAWHLFHEVASLSDISMCWLTHSLPSLWGTQNIECTTSIASIGKWCKDFTIRWRYSLLSLVCFQCSNMDCFHVLVLIYYSTHIFLIVFSNFLHIDLPQLWLTIVIIHNNNDWQ